MKVRVDGKVVVVTGAGRGIGRGIAERLVADGATVVATDVDGSAAAETGRALGGESTGLHVDVTSVESIASMVQSVTERFGGIDVLVNNAGWDTPGRFLESDPDLWDRIVRINLFGVLHMSKAVVPVIVARGGGSVVNIGSEAARFGSAGEAVYSAAKGGVIAFTKTLAREVARSGINVNCVCPGPTDTALLAEFAGPELQERLRRSIPLRRLGQPADIANAVAFFASDDASFITGQTLSVSGGLTMI